MAGPMAPPIRGANIMVLMATPRLSGANMSPTMAGLRTFDATARPVRARAVMNSVVLWLTAARMMHATKRELQKFMSGYLPYISDSGAMSSGPAASPSSHMVSRSTLSDLLASPPSRSSVIRVATGTTDMHVKVLRAVRRNSTVSNRVAGVIIVVSYTVKAMAAKSATIVHLNDDGQFIGLSGSPSGSKSIMWARHVWFTGSERGPTGWPELCWRRGAASFMHWHETGSIVFSTKFWIIESVFCTAKENLRGVRETGKLVYILRIGRHRHCSVLISA